MKMLLKKTMKSKIVSLILIFLFFALGTLGVPSSDEIEQFTQVKGEYIAIGIIFIIIVTLTFFKDLTKDFKLYFAKFGKNFGLSIKYFIIIIVGFFLTRILSTLILGDVNTTPKNDSAIYETFKLFPVYIIFVTNIYSPYVEEIIFRKSLSDLIKNKFLFIIISGITFGILHVSFDVTGDWLNFGSIFATSILVLPYVFFAGALAYVYRRENNILIPITIRIIYNAIVTIMAII
jgi:membrane protease YdiL (CAAX protease family)